MASIIEDLTPRATLGRRLSRFPTGAKLLLILSGALLPLALIAVFATLQTSRVADQDARARLRVAAAESSRSLAIELLGDATALRVALNALAQDPANGPVCARAQGVFAPQGAEGAQFEITRTDGTMICGTPLRLGKKVTPAPGPGLLAARIVPSRGLAITMAAPDGGARATALFPAAFLSQVSRPSGFVIPYRLVLRQDDDSLELQPYEDLPTFRTDQQRMELGIDDLALEMTVASEPVTSPMVLAMLLPLVMWLAAAGISWFVVDRLLIRPLRDLRTSVAAFSPGEVIDPVAVRRLPAHEIRELGDTFRAISRTVALHEADLAAGLIRQTKLTKEVHHRVKNNLQVIASLINFHSRSASGAEAAAAYASIQRRVDALAVVHRNHHAESEENRGLPLRGMIGELASNIRATAPPESAGLGITLDIAPYFVSQDTAVATAFLATEAIELAMSQQPDAQLRLSLREGADDGHAVFRISSAALIETERLRTAIDERYGRVMTGLSRQLRGTLHHDPLVGAFEIVIAVVGRD